MLNKWQLLSIMSANILCYTVPPYIQLVHRIHTVQKMRTVHQWPFTQSYIHAIHYAKTLFHPIVKSYSTYNEDMWVCHIYSAWKQWTLWGMVVIDPRCPSPILVRHEKWRGLVHGCRLEDLYWKVDTTHIATSLAVYITSCGSNQSTLQHYNYSKPSTLGEMSLCLQCTQIELIRPLCTFNTTPGQTCGSKQEPLLRLLATLDSPQGQLSH